MPKAAFNVGALQPAVQYCAVQLTLFDGMDMAMPCQQDPPGFTDGRRAAKVYFRTPSKSSSIWAFHIGCGRIGCRVTWHSQQCRKPGV